jgi:hypothetical protein
MQPLFTTNLNIDGSQKPFEVSFENESYKFSSISGDHMEFKLLREEDEWHCSDQLPDDLKNTAIDILEEYLLKQH